MPGDQVVRWPPFPLVQTLQRDGVCAEVIAPAPDSSDALRAEAARIAETIATELDVTGVLAVELFEDTDGVRRCQ